MSEKQTVDVMATWMKHGYEPPSRTRVKSVEDAFADWDHSHRPEQYDVELRAFKAGWVAGVRNEWAKERND